MEKTVSLRSWKRSDEKWLIEYADNPRVAKNLADLFPQPYDQKAAEEWFRICVDGEEKDFHSVIMYGDEPVGCIGALPGKGSHSRKIFLGYWIGEPYWGLGIASKAVGIICSGIWTESPEIIRIESHAYEWNVASMRVLEKNGFVKEGVMKNRLWRDGAIHDEHYFAKYRKGDNNLSDNSPDDQTNTKPDD